MAQNWWKFWRREESQVETPAEESQNETPANSTPRTGGGLTVYIPGQGLYMPGSDESLTVATVYRCVELLSNGVANLTLEYMRWKDGRYQPDTNNVLSYLLSVQPMPVMSIYDFWSFAVRQMLLEGNAYIVPRVILGEITDLVLCGNNTVSHDDINETYTVTDPYNGVFGTFKEDEVIHLYLHTSDGRNGESVLAHARRVAGIAMAGDNETANRFTNGGNVRGIVSNDKSAIGFGEYQDEELEKTAENIDSRFSNGEHIVSLPGQVDFKQISLSSTDMQFLESRKFTVREICRFFGVNPSFVFDDTSNNYKSAEMANITFLSMTLDPILKRIEAEFNRKLVARSQYTKRLFKFNRKGIYSLDLQSLADYQKKTIEAGIYTINDWRRLENLPEVPGGDTVHVSTNLAPLGSPKLSGSTNNNEE